MTLYVFTQGFGGATNCNVSLTAGSPGLRLVGIDLTNENASNADLRLVRAVGSLTGGNTSSNINTCNDGDLPSTPAATGKYGAVSYSGATPSYLCQWSLAPGAVLPVRFSEPLRLNSSNSFVLEAPYSTVNLYFEE